MIWRPLGLALSLSPIFFYRYYLVYFINLIINIAKLDIIHTIDIQNVILNIRPMFLGIGSTLLNVRIMNTNVLKFIIYDIFLYS